MAHTAAEVVWWWVLLLLLAATIVLGWLAWRRGRHGASLQAVRLARAAAQPSKIIWMYWEQGEAAIEDDDTHAGSSLTPGWYIKMCLHGWRTLNPAWDVRILDATSCKEYVSDMGNYEHLTVQFRSDILRFKLLHQYGGVWADVTLLPMKPLDQWLNDATEHTGLFLYRQRGWPDHGSVANWFIAAPLAGNSIVKKWGDAYESNLSKPGADLNPTKWSFPYFLCHHTLDALAQRDPEVKHTLDQLHETAFRVRAYNTGVPTPPLTCAAADLHPAMYKRHYGIDPAAYARYLGCFSAPPPAKVGLSTYCDGIPKVIYMCYKNLRDLKKYSKNWKKLNPDYKIELYDDDRCKDFLRKEYSQLHVDIFDYVKDGPIKSDFWRVCIINKYGGLYVDADIEPLVPLNEYIEEDDDFVTCISQYYDHVQYLTQLNPQFILTRKNNKILQNCIDEYIRMYLNKKEYSYWEWSIGAIMFIDILQTALVASAPPNVLYDKNTKYKFIHEINNNDCVYNGNLVLHNRYKDYQNHSFPPPPAKVGLSTYCDGDGEKNENCCNCPTVPCDKINDMTRQARTALDRVVPGKWFLVEGTLIGALRWGEHCHKFKSGKTNFVDGDMDVYIITEESHTSQVVVSIGAILNESGWSEPKDRGDGIFVTNSPLRVPRESCTINLGTTVPFYMDIHVMHPAPDGFVVGNMEHLWTAFLRNGILPHDVIYPLAKCSWGGGLAYAPAKYLEVLTKWNSNEYGSASGMWRPIERILATGEWFDCECKLSSQDLIEIKESIRSLKSRGLASFNVVPKIVVSLTTIPVRLPKLEKVLRALTDQSVVDVVYLNLPYICTKTSTKYDPLPAFLGAMNKLKVQRCEDYGPLTKLLPTLETELDPSTIIIVCDDDMLYEGHGWALGLATAVDSTTAAAYGVRKDDELTILMGYKGFAFQRQVFAPGYLKFFLNLSRACKFGDDYSISYYLKGRGVKVVQIKEQPGAIVDLEHHGMPEFSLKHGAALTQGNDANYKQCKKELPPVC